MDRKRARPAAVALVALLVAAFKITTPFVGGVMETWETSNGVFRLRVVSHSERFAVVGGGYYFFQSAPAGSDDWKRIMVFRHDDPLPIPREQVRFVDERTAYVFMGWMYAVTTDAGATWSVWDCVEAAPGVACNYGFIKDVRLGRNGSGVMTANRITSRGDAEVHLHTKDYGRHWTLARQ
jgi:hypothetical protein